MLHLRARYDWDAAGSDWRPQEVTRGRSVQPGAGGKAPGLYLLGTLPSNLPADLFPLAGDLSLNLQWLRVAEDSEQRYG